MFTWCGNYLASVGVSNSSRNNKMITTIKLLPLLITGQKGKKAVVNNPTVVFKRLNWADAKLK